MRLGLVGISWDKKKEETLSRRRNLQRNWQITRAKKLGRLRKKKDEKNKFGQCLLEIGWTMNMLRLFLVCLSLEFLYKLFYIGNKPSPRIPEWRGFAGLAMSELVPAVIKELFWPTKPYLYYDSLAYLIRTCHEGHYRAGGLIGVSRGAPLGSQPCQRATIVLISHCKLPEREKNLMIQVPTHQIKQNWVNAWEKRQ